MGTTLTDLCLDFWSILWETEKFPNGLKVEDVPNLPIAFIKWKYNIYKEYLKYVDFGKLNPSKLELIEAITKRYFEEVK